MPAEPTDDRPVPASLNVLHVSMPTTAGVPTVVLACVEDQVGRGWSVTVACPEDGWLAGMAASAGAQVVAWPARRGPGPRTLGETRRLAAVMRHAQPDIVHLHSAKAGLAGRLALRGRTPTVFQPHAWSFLAVDGPVSAATKAWERFAARWTHGLICVSEAERRLGAAASIRPATWVVPNGVDTDVLRPVRPGTRGALRRQLGLPDAPTAICVGRLARQKGQDVLLEAWDAVVREIPEARLILVGDGPDHAMLGDLTRHEGSVTLVGERDDVSTWLAVADVVTAPSRWEGMALVPLEAMACGRSVVMTDVTGAAETIPDGAGAIVPVEDVDALSSALITRLENPSLAEREGHLGREHVEKHHSRAATTTSIAQVYAAVLDQSQP